MKLITKRDFLIIAAIFLVGAALLLIPSFLGGGETAKIIVDGEVIREVKLSENMTFTENGLTFEVRDNKIAVTSSPCKDKICVHTGFIGSPSRTIVCLPERTTVVISGDAHADLVIG